jgi:hypothetical protein
MGGTGKESPGSRTVGLSKPSAAVSTAVGIPQLDLARLAGAAKFNSNSMSDKNFRDATTRVQHELDNYASGTGFSIVGTNPYHPEVTMTYTKLSSGQWEGRFHNGRETYWTRTDSVMAAANEVVNLLSQENGGRLAR